MRAWTRTLAASTAMATVTRAVVRIMPSMGPRRTSRLGPLRDYGPPKDTKIRPRRTQRPQRMCALRFRDGTPPCRAGQEEAEHERRNTQQTRADEEQCVAFEQRPSRCQLFDRDSGESFGEFSDVRVRGAEKSVLSCRVAKTGQAR